MILSLCISLRIFKILMHISTFKKIQGNLKTALIDFRNFFLILLLILFVFAMAGAALFKDKIKFNDKGEVDLINGTNYKFNFQSLGASMVTVFILIISDDWNEIMY